MNVGILKPLKSSGDGALWLANDAAAARCRTTRWSVVLAAAADGDAARFALDQLYRIYWQPVFSAIARQRGLVAAWELTQAFFVKRLIIGRDLRRVQRRPGQRFRGWLFTALNSFLKNQRAFERRQCRDLRKTIGLGNDGDDVVLPTAALTAAQPDPEQLLHRARVLSLLSRVLGRLRDEYRRSAASSSVDAERRFEAVKTFLPGRDSETADYRDVAAALGTTSDAVKQLVLRLRRRFAQLLEDEIRQRVGEDEADVRSAKRLLCQALEIPAGSQGEP